MYVNCHVANVWEYCSDGDNFEYRMVENPQTERAVEIMGCNLV